MLTLFSLDVLFALNEASDFDIHAILVSGSKSFAYYRQQAAVFHAYKILLNHGVPRKNNIVMKYDDIVYNKDNPCKGKIFNIPNGKDVYIGVERGYIKDEVSAENFTKVLKGDNELERKGKKVTRAKPNNHIFVYLASLGGAGLVTFPSDILTSFELNDYNQLHERS